TLAIAFLAVFSTVIATVTWSYALARTPAPHAAAFLYLVAPLSIVIAWAWLGERPSAMTWAGGAVALAGVGVVRWAARPVHNEHNHAENGDRDRGAHPGVLAVRR
ncbi:MAG TPA: DMT family transporter, partial [Thermoanaerobaculia bacterium]|nr:DMT family transporter [Thermoanaerobaculia bacterium]